MIKDIDTILYVVEPIIESSEADPRYNNKGGYDIRVKYGKGSPDYIDPALNSQFAFGKALQNSLNNMGDGFSAEVTDFGQWIVVRVSHNNVTTGISCSKTFLVVFSSKSKGMVFSTSNKWRTIDGYNQAATYIRSASNALKTSTQSKI